MLAFLHSSSYYGNAGYIICKAEVEEVHMHDSSQRQAFYRGYAAHGDSIPCLSLLRIAQTDLSLDPQVMCRVKLYFTSSLN